MFPNKKKKTENFFVKIDENCVKAFIHKGRALTYLKKFDDAINEFEKAKKFDPKIIDSINGNFNDSNNLIKKLIIILKII